MSLLVDTKYRSDATELMDDFSIEGDLLRDTLDKLDGINKWLGGNAITLNGVQKLIEKQPRSKTVTIIDLGCGGGDMLRKLADFGKKESYNFKLIGVDANQDAVNYGRELSVNYPEIQYLHLDIFSEEFSNLNYDIVICTLFLHHFKEEELLLLLEGIYKKVNLGIVINDLHRHPMAYYLFKCLSLGIQNNMIKQDGLTSILRGFKRKELEKISEQLKVKSQIYWKWAFRYQWIIKK